MPEDTDRLIATMTALTVSLECLCRQVGALREVVARTDEHSTLLRHRLERVDGRLDGFERFMAQNRDLLDRIGAAPYPEDRTQGVPVAMVPFRR